MSWTTIWSADGPVLKREGLDQTMSAATFLLEGRPSARVSEAAPVWSGHGADALSVKTTQDGAIDLRHRAMHLRSEPGIVEPGGAYRLIYRNRTEGTATLEVRSLERPGIACVSTAFARAPLLTADFVPAEPVMRQLGGLAALANHNVPMADGVGLQAGTLVETPAGPQPIEALRPGDVVITGAHSQAMVTKSEQAEAVTLGSTNAVRLRAPYFGLSQDVFLARNTQILLSGPDIDYTFGTAQVTAEAGDLVNHVSVMRDLSEPVRDLVRVELDRPGCLQVGRLRIAGAPDATDCPKVDRIGAQSLLTQNKDLRAVMA